MKKKVTPLLFMVCCLGALLFSLGASAQRTIKGKITSSSDHSAVVGATVQLKGTSTGTVTSSDGSYSISVTGQSPVLVVSYIGFKSQEIAVEGRNTVNVALEESANNLNELVVTGYTSQRKGDITGAVSVVKAIDLVSIPQGNAEQQLQGRVSGLTVITSGEPGTSSQVRIRGYGSFTNNNPLYIVDGVPTYDISFINSNDIETTTILKDAGSASIYGARAAAGVILITTKHGKEGPLQVTYNGSYGWQFPGKGYSMLNPQQTADWTWQAYKNAGEDPTTSAQAAQYGTGANPVLPDYILAGTQYGLSASNPAVNPKLYDGTYVPATGHLAYQIVKANKAGTNWYEAVTRVAPIQNQALSLSGGTNDAQYNVGLDYFNQQGIILNTYLKRYTARINTDFNIHNRLKIGENMQVALLTNPQIAGSNQSEGNAISWSYRENPLIPVRDIMGNWAGTYAKGFNNPQNGVADQTRAGDNTGSNNYVFGNLYADLKLPYYLTLHSSFGGYYYNYYYQNYGWQTYENAEPVTNNTVNEGGGYGWSWTWTNTLNFSHKFGSSSISAIAGTEAIKDGVGGGISGSGLNPFSWDLLYRSINTTQSSGRSVGDNPSVGYRLYSYFGNINYNYDDRYLISATIRHDGSSNFGSEKRYGTFPAVSVGWRMSQENFMKSVAWINDLKLRASWGISGNQQAVPNTNQYNLYGTNPGSASYDIGGTNNSLAEGLIRTNLANPLGHWESSVTSNVGFDATLFNGTFQVVADLYQRNTKDLLYNPQVSANVGYFPSYPYINIGSMQNKGVDLMFDEKVDFNSDWHFEGNLSVTTYSNKITKVANGITYFDGNSFGSGRIPGAVARNEVGHPISAFFGYKVVGLWQSQAEISAADAQAQKATGNADATYQSGGEHVGEFRYADVTNQGYISDASRTFIGNPNPKLTAGLNLTLSYKNFDIKTFFYESYGNDAFAYTKWFTDFFPSFPGGGVSSRVLNSWTPTHTNTNVPIFEDRGTFSTNQTINSYYVEKASYLRFKDLEVGYTFTKGTLQKAGISNLRVYVQGLNLFTITKYDGLDPELTGYDTNFGVDYGNYPVVRQFLIGVNATF